MNTRGPLPRLSGIERLLNQAKEIVMNGAMLNISSLTIFIVILQNKRVYKEKH